MTARPHPETGTMTDAPESTLGVRRRILLRVAACRSCAGTIGPVQLTVLDGLLADHDAAVQLWSAANVARLITPSPVRAARIWEKLADPDACFVVGRSVGSEDVLAMALAEPGRAEHGVGEVTPGYGHVSMVFVHPDLWGRGVGRQLLQGLHQRASQRSWDRTTLWTRSSNERARRLYEGQGYRASGHEAKLGDGDPIFQLERQIH